MDPNNCLKKVTDLNEYISFTRDVENKSINLKVLPFNMTTILSLKSIRSIEIEYFNKYDENGAAATIFEFMLNFPPSKTWSLLGKELVHTLQYWLEAVRKHLIVHNVHWWTFLKLLLKFIKVLNSKDSSMNKILIEEIADCLLDLATHSVPEVAQRYEIIQTFNSFCAESSRNIRFAFKDNFQNYFVKLSTILATCGDLRLQYSILETLLRWLLPRHEPAVRLEAADKWFPPELCNRNALEIFLGRPWQNFMKDARDFLNARNEFDDSITSVRCTKLTIGTGFCIAAKPRKEYWVDVNSSTKFISMLLDPNISETLGRTTQTCDTLIISEDNTCKVELKRVSHQVEILATVLELSQVYPFSNNVPEDSMDISMCVECRADIPRLDRALRAVFMDKYQCSVDLENLTTLEPEDKRESLDVINDTEEDTRFSMPVEVRRRKHSGYIVRSKNPRLLNSPSTVSTSSLAQLHEKLEALPLYTFDKEPVSVCAQPQLSSVTEVSESEENRTLNNSLSTVRLRTYGVYQRANVRTNNSKTSSSDNSRDNKPAQLSPVCNDNENSVSCLLIATIGSADDSVINETIERLPKDIPCNTDNIIDLLAKEALQGSVVKQDDGLNNVIQDDGVNELPHVNDFQINKYITEKHNTKDSHDTVIENNEERHLNNAQLTDETSNEIVENTPAHFVTVRRSKRVIERNIPNSKIYKDASSVVTHDIQEIEDFFTKHVSENNNGELVISPTLAKKINETSSECSEDFDRCLLACNYIVRDIEQDLVPDIDVVECLNSLVDKVCKEFDKCTNYLEFHIGMDSDKSSVNTNIQGDFSDNTKSKKSKQKKKPIKLKFTSNRSLSRKKNLRNSSKVDNSAKPFSVMSPIIERETIVDESLTKDVNSPKSSDKNLDTPLLKRKRKLYSPNVKIPDENVVDYESTEDNSTTNSELRVYSKTPKSTATCYKELERERKKRIRQPRNRRSKTNTDSTVSPRTVKMNQIFDSLKEKTDGEAVILVDKNDPDRDIAVYNYTSDEDENDQNNSKSALAKLTKTPDTAKTTAPRRTRKRTVTTNKAETPSENGKKTTKRDQTSKRMISRRQKHNTTAIPEHKRNLEDERMRSAAPEILNTSILIPSPNEMKQHVTEEPRPILKHKPEMECIITEDDRKSNENDGENIKRNNQHVKSKRVLSLKRNKDTQKVNVDLIDLSTVDKERTVSPLPGLVVETAQKAEDPDDSVNAYMLQKFKNIYEDKDNTIEGNGELNTTQNLLSDLEQNNCSNQLIFNEALEKEVIELHEIPANKRADNDTKSDKENKNEITTEKKNKTRKILKIKRERCSTKSQVNETNDIIHLSNSTKIASEKSMATMGNTRSPITGHGDFDELPPSSSLLKQHIEPRIVEQEYLDQSLKDFFTKLTKDMDAMMGGSYKSDNGKCPSKRNSKSDYCSSTKSHNSKVPVVSLSRLSIEDIRSLTSNNSKASTNNKRKSKIDRADSFKSSKKITHTDKDKNIRLEKSIKTRSFTKAKMLEARKTMISPIEPFKGSTHQIPSEPNSPRSQKDQLSKHASTKNPASIQSKASEVTTKSVKISRPTRKVVKKTDKTPNPSSSKSSSVDVFKGAESKSCKTSTSVYKRHSSPILGLPKRSKLEENNNCGNSTDVQSGPSLSSIDEWFKRNVPGTAESVSLSIKDNIKNVLEKLDTTLLEIHHNTSRRFINLFVDTQKHLGDLMSKRQDLYKNTAREIISGVVKMMDDKFSELDERSKTIDEEFMKKMKERAHNLLQEDCKQKRVMVTLLREDVQAVLDHMDRSEGNLS